MSKALPESIVYVIKNLGTNHYKIGVTSDMPTRLQKLQTGNSYKLEVVVTITTTDAYKLEALLHDCYKHLRLEGEWFMLEQEDIDYMRSLSITMQPEPSPFAKHHKQKYYNRKIRPKKYYK